MKLFRRNKADTTEDRAIWSGGAPYGLPNIPDWHDVSRANILLSDTDALTVPAFFRGVAIKTDLVAGMPLAAYEGDVKLDVQPSFLVQPDPSEAREDTISRLVMSLIMRGNAFAILDFDELGFARALKAVHPSLVDIRRYENGTYTYVIADKEYDPSVVMHIRNSMLMPGEFFGLSCVQMCRRALDRAIRVEEFGRVYFADNATPGAVITVERKEFSPEEAADVKSRWISAQSGSRAPVVIPGDMKFTPINISPEDSQFIETEVHGLTTVANIVGLPGYFIGAPGASMTYSNAESEAINLLKFYLPEVRKVEAAFTALLPDGIVAKFNADSLLRVDAKTRAETEQIWKNAGIYTVNELRAKENLPPVSGGDELAKPSPAPAPSRSVTQ